MHFEVLLRLSDVPGQQLSPSEFIPIAERYDLIGKPAPDLVARGLGGENDFRKLRACIESGDENARLAYDVYIHRLRKYVGAYLAVLGRTDVISFTAGVGENDAAVRRDALAGLTALGIEIDEELNASPSREARRISTPESPVTVLVVPTNEELAIAQACAALACR